MSEQNLVESTKAVVDDRVDALADAAKAAGGSAIETPSQVVAIASNALGGSTGVAGKTFDEVIDLLRDKAKDVTDAIAKATKVITG